MKRATRIMSIRILSLDDMVCNINEGLLSREVYDLG